MIVSEIETDVDLSQMAQRLKEESQQLEGQASQQDLAALVIDAQPGPALDPHFADNLKKSLAEPLQRLQDIASAH